ncbi:rhodanese-like domain-containing protein [Mesorhizobium sp. INR15]|uniref:rhodanese-like domain-containing protein n=1 Tax=Mesorhizobium sp. INR15 TaxID=2654248 RepID=UPI0018968070|nr:rhodanese-like domain-containing protein [Mesorhizobium sp. INR15]QPC94556.1 sulfurtransferase [Mesorhizobium sp. INR15]
MRFPSPVNASTAKAWLSDGQELALVDVREAGEFASGHPLFATSLPFGLLEAKLPVLVPSTACRTVFMDDGYSQRAERAAEIALRLGYLEVFFLDGGVGGWQRSGLSLFEGVFVPSKAFGELVEEAFSVPHVSPEELNRWQQEGRKLVLLDGRPLDEHRRMNIPGSICLPNGELAYRAGAAIPDPLVPVVVHCAGRTRSIIGAQILRDLGFPNPIFALENGTQGWALAGLDLERGSDRAVQEAPSEHGKAEMHARARSLAEGWKVPFVDVATANSWVGDETRTTYLLDVRGDAEFHAHHIEGATHAPGGQLIQSTDQWVAVRRARIVLIDDAGIRAVVVARYLSMMGLDCHVLAGAEDVWGDIVSPLPPRSAVPELPHVPLPFPDDAVILDVRPSMAYRLAHVAGAQWVLRHQLGDRLSRVPKTAVVVLCGQDADVVGLAAGDINALGFHNLFEVAGTAASWREAGLEVVSTPEQPSDAEALDFVFFTHDRHSGNLEAARRYLSWETGLVGRLDAAEQLELGRGLRARTNPFAIAQQNEKRLSNAG